MKFFGGKREEKKEAQVESGGVNARAQADFENLTKLMKSLERTKSEVHKLIGIYRESPLIFVPGVLGYHPVRNIGKMGAVRMLSIVRDSAPQNINAVLTEAERIDAKVLPGKAVKVLENFLEMGRRVETYLNAQMSAKVADVMLESMKMSDKFVKEIDNAIWSVRKARSRLLEMR
jgi:hypothetical protein